MSTQQESSEKTVATTQPEIASPGVQLTELLTKFGEMASEMAAQKKLIDELVSSGVRPEPVPATQPQSEPFVIPPFQTTFEGTFNPQYAFTQNPPFYPSYSQGFQPQSDPNMHLNPPVFYQTTAEPVIPEHTFQNKPEMGESSAPIDMKLLRRLDRFDEFIRKSQGLNKQGVLDYDDLCLFPSVQLPEGLFPESLEGDALDWYSNLKLEDVKTWIDLSNAFVRQYEYNCELTPTRTTLEGTKRKPSEDHKTYAKRWRKVAAKVEPPMTEDEIIRTFIKAHDPPYFEEIFRMTGCSFAAIVNKLEEFDDFVRAGKIVNVSALKSQLDALQGQGSNAKKPPFKKKEGDATFIWNQDPSPRPRYQHNPTYQPPYHYYPNPYPVYTTNIHHPRPRPSYPNPPVAPFQISQPNPPQNRPRPPYNPRFPPPNRPAYNHPQPPEPYNRPPSLRRREAQGPNVNRNPLPEHANIIGVILDDTEYVEPVRELAREAEVFGVTDQPFVIELPFEEDEKPFILDLTPAEREALEPVVIEFPKQEPVLSLQQVPWNYDEPDVQIGEKSIAKKEASVVTRSGKIASPFEAAIPI
ncbi:uncharacterized protein LOC113777382 [Coffea eugenioides]|uniref:uncharacterized protein LOC113777382 n=1 Tax=Coffea eugenioides TaxID=49369 RepID=UPI000F60AD3E|nr:uncharacterized protein LOC113777382 [Coffea eugenioides]